MLSCGPASVGGETGERSPKRHLGNPLHLPSLLCLGAAVDEAALLAALSEEDRARVLKRLRKLQERQEREDKVRQRSLDRRESQTSSSCPSHAISST